MRVLRFSLCILMALCLSACNVDLSTMKPEDYRSKAKQSTVTGLVNATEIDIASKVPGRVLRVYVREGDFVQKGDILLELSIDELNAKLGQAESAVEAAKAQLLLANKGARPQEKKAALEQVRAAQHQVDIAKKMYDRSAALLGEGALPQAKFDEAEFKYSVARNQLQMAKERHSALLNGARSEEIMALEAMVARGENAALEIEVYRRENIQKAPISGEISGVILHEGELANTGYPIISIVDLDDIWVSFALREDKLSTIEKGDVFTVFVPALNKEVEMYLAHISGLGDFATWKATSQHNSFDLKSFEVRLRPIEKIPGLRPGMTVRWEMEKQTLRKGHVQPKVVEAAESTDAQPESEIPVIENEKIVEETKNEKSTHRKKRDAAKSAKNDLGNLHDK